MLSEFQNYDNRWQLPIAGLSTCSAEHHSEWGDEIGRHNLIQLRVEAFEMKPSNWSSWIEAFKLNHSDWNLRIKTFELNHSNWSLRIEAFGSKNSLTLYFSRPFMASLSKYFILTTFVDLSLWVFVDLWVQLLVDLHWNDEMLLVVAIWFAGGLQEVNSRSHAECWKGASDDAHRLVMVSDERCLSMTDDAGHWLTMLINWRCRSPMIATKHRCHWSKGFQREFFKKKFQGSSCEALSSAECQRNWFGPENRQSKSIASRFKVMLRVRRLNAHTHN